MSFKVTFAKTTMRPSKSWFSCGFPLCLPPWSSSPSKNHQSINSGIKKITLRKYWWVCLEAREQQQRFPDQDLWVLQWNIFGFESRPWVFKALMMHLEFLFTFHIRQYWMTNKVELSRISTSLRALEICQSNAESGGLGNWSNKDIDCKMRHVNLFRQQVKEFIWLWVHLFWRLRGMTMSEIWGSIMAW